MSTGRLKEQADFDLERFIEMFDEALTSEDERVINALRSLMMMVILTKPEVDDGIKIGPLRQMFDDLHNINRRMHSLEDTIRQMEYNQRRDSEVSRSHYAGSYSNSWPHDSANYSLGKDFNLTSSEYKAALAHLSGKVNKP